MRSRLIAEIAVLGFVVSRGDKAKKIGVLVQKRKKEPDRMTGLAVYQRGEAGPERRHRARAADDARTSTHIDDIAGAGGCIARDVRHAAADNVRTDVLRHLCFSLIVRQGKDVADAATCAAGSIIPDALLGDHVAVGGDGGATAADRPRA